jgi:WhiB family transcriptional regulator, redox-sensing transcriptional regulator
MQHHSLGRLLTLLADEHWRPIAACRTAEPDLFFPVSAADNNRLQVTEAKAVCAGCLVRRECLDFAIRTRQMHGIWGGLTEEERYPVVRAHQQRVHSAGAGAQPRLTPIGHSAL